ncbi:winged helix-turn-helix transcriptional regulator [Streptomyces minutiscleroticus]|uniref:winged helix-turn-helix transcriptional regulator n=1 Tax=Streptomyces minutiscleroticus TaxID=68238 RepID=UPI003319648F
MALRDEGAREWVVRAYLDRPWLTQTLRRLERNGLIQRRVLATSPLGVEYSLTHLGESFREPFTRLYDWTVEHSDEVLAAQHEYDARSSGQ